MCSTLAFLPAPAAPGAERHEGDDERTVRAQQQGDAGRPGCSSAPAGQSAGRWYIWPIRAMPAREDQDYRRCRRIGARTKPLRSSHAATCKAPRDNAGEDHGGAPDSCRISSQFAHEGGVAGERRAHEQPERAGSQPPLAATERRMALARSALSKPSPTQRVRSASGRLR